MAADEECRSPVEIITQAMAEARQSEHDHAGQGEQAVMALLATEPGLSYGPAHRLVETLVS
ncbi:MAG TPA: hypothetical protein VD978_09410 [Azospirillum sp.]|nr:hypothetical protein [Azospirillum sp.]